MTHPLKQWLNSRQPKMTMAELAAQVGVHPISLRRLINADDSVSRKIFEDIERATEGGVPAVTLFAFYQQQRLAQRLRDAAAATAER